MVRRPDATTIALVIALGYAIAVYLIAGTGAADWAPVAWARTQSFGPALLLLAPIAVLAAMIRGGASASIAAICRDFVATRIVPGFGIPFLMPVITAVVTGTAYMIFKQQVLPRTGFGADRWLADLDRALLGTDAWRISHQLFPGPTATWLLDLAYHPFFFPMSFGIALCLLLPLGSVARHRYMLAYSLILIGPATILSWLMPGVGPCFDLLLHGATHYAPLMQHLAEQQAWLAAQHGHRLVALDNQATLGALFRAGDIANGAGISAMPSIHNALSTLFICFVVSLRPKLAWIMIPCGALILVGSVHLGWHYAVDSIAGIVLAILTWAATGPIARGFAGAIRSAPVSRARAPFATRPPTAAPTRAG